jgi:leucyl aminopeptidase
MSNDFIPSKLPPGTYSLTGAINANSAALGWALGTYSFDRYKSKKEDKEGDAAQSAEGSSPKVTLTWPEGADRSVVSALAQGFFLARDMVTTPAEDMTPQDIAAEAVTMATTHGASSNVIVGDDLLTENYPAIHMVGRASINPPHLVDLRWAPKGTKDASSLPKVTLVGKGVSFDTGGLDLKPASAMKLMKKDMGGSALILALAHTIMATGLPVSLRVLIPTVENSVSGNAYRPLDVLQTRAGITVENGNTDAEGRLILCDALAEAIKETPEIIIDAATLTGAARVALGTELPALFCNDDAVADDLIKAAREVNDPMWRMPLHQPYRKMLDSKVADIYSCSEGGYGGAITAALFLQEFVKDVEGTTAWVHIDTMGYNNSSKPGRPEGGEAYALRGVFEFLQRKYKK